MNYIELEIGGAKRGFRFGLGCLGEMVHELGIDVSELDDFLTKNPIKGIPTLVYHGAKYEVRRMGDEVDFTIYDVYDWIEDLEGGINDAKIATLIDVFTKSLSKDVPKVEGDGAKKK